MKPREPVMKVGVIIKCRCQGISTFKCQIYMFEHMPTTNDVLDEETIFKNAELEFRRRVWCSGCHALQS